MPVINVTYGQNVYGREEKRAVLDVFKAGNLMVGRRAMEFEGKVASLFGKKHGVMVNSGSSANLLAVELVRAPRGSSAITPILTFSTTLAPLLQKGLKPVFVDVEEGTYLANVKEVRDGAGGNVKLLMLPHLLGNVLNLPELQEIARENNLTFIEDSCDTLGTTFGGKPTGTYADISTTSFYGSHVLTTAGSGGMLCINRDDWDRRARVLRGWGRSSAINEYEDMNARFSCEVDGIPYDSKFVFEEEGYNLQPTEIGAAFGLAQLEKLQKFRHIRKRNFVKLYRFFRSYPELFILPKQNGLADTCWITFPLTITPNAKFTRRDIVRYLEERSIQTRPVFTGNVLRQPGFKYLTTITARQDYPVADDIMRNGFTLPAHHGLKREHMDYMLSVLSEFLGRY